MSLEKGKWSFVKTDTYCYIGSLAEETDLPPEKNRGEYYILVNKTNKHFLKKIKAKMKIKKELKPFSYNSGTNKYFLTVQQIANLIKKN